jgi:tetratricopeptide (TPR) repeat protein
VIAEEIAKFKPLPNSGADSAQFRLPVADGQIEFHDLPALTGYPFHNQPKEFIGRNEDMRRVLACINDYRAVVILGVSGVGKTELAKQTARRLVTRGRVHIEKVGFAALVNARTVDEARAEIARALKLAPDEVLDNETLQQLIPRNTLVILDEAENVILRDGAAFRQLVEVLVGAPGSPIVIVTSQTDPNTSFAPVVQTRRLSVEAASHLFAVNANLTPEQLQSINRHDLSELLNYVDRIPRAVELIARVWRHERGSNPESLDLTSLLAQLRTGHDRVMQDPVYPDEVRSVTIGVQYAYDRLRERRTAAADLWAHLSLFPSGISKAGLTHIFGPNAAELANEIQAQSLVEFPFGHLPSLFSDLMQLPTPFLLFALRQLPEGSETAARKALGESVLSYYYASDEKPYRGWVELLDQSVREGGKGIGSFIVRYEAELPSIEAWLDWGYEFESGLSAGSRAARLTAELTNLYRVKARSYRDRLDRALACAQRCADELGEANVRWALSDLLMRSNELGDAREQADMALAIYSRIGHRVGQSNALLVIGSVLRAEGDLTGAREKYNAALNICRDVGFWFGETNALKMLADLSLREGDPGTAREQYEAALSIYRLSGNKLGEANTLMSLGELLGEEGYSDDAIARLREAFDIHADIGNLHGVGSCVAFWAHVVDATGRHDQATLLCQLAVEIFRLIPDRSSEASTLVYQGEALSAFGLGPEAMAALWLAREIYIAVGDSLAEGIDRVFKIYEAEVGSEKAGELVASLQSQAEDIRERGVNEVWKTAGDDSLVREIGERLQELLRGRGR